MMTAPPRSSSSLSSSSRSGRGPIVTVFQASPVAYEDVEGATHPLPNLDLDSERDALREALDGTGIDVAFHTATADRLGEFLAIPSHRLLQFSCHGHERYLFIENDHGGGRPLLINENLKSWIQAGGNNLELVYVSACCSRPAGEAFLQAGVKHVICCERAKDFINNIAAIVFARAFYQALAYGRTIQQAFDLAKKSILFSDRVKDPELEAAKITLLPKEGNHDTILFEPVNGKDLSPVVNPVSPTNGRLPAPKLTRLPVPPQLFLGRELDIYNVLLALFRSEGRLARITGPKGIGKVSLAKAVATYVARRNLSRYGVTWMPPIFDKGSDKMDICWSHVFNAIENDQDPRKFLTNDTYVTAKESVLENLFDKKVLVVIDCSRMTKKSIQKLSIFLDDTFERTKHVKVIVVHQMNVSLKSKHITGFPNEREIALGPLEFEDTVKLFGKVCPHATSGTTHKWVPKVVQQKKSKSLFSILGGGSPTKAILAARTMTEAEYKKLVSKGEEIRLRDFESSIGNVDLSLTTNSFPSSEGFDPRLSKFARDRSLELLEKEEENMEEPRIRSRDDERPPLRTQAEVSSRFVPLLKKEGKIYRKNVASYIKKARVGDHVVTTIDGVKETEYHVEDDASWVVCGKAAGEYYVISDDNFHDCYEESSAKEISIRDSSDGDGPRRRKRLRQQGYLEYQSKRKIWARKVTTADIDWFHRGNNRVSMTQREAYFEA